MRWYCLTIWLVVGLAFCAVPVAADGMIVPNPPGEGPLPLDTLTITHHRVTVDIDDRLAVTHVDQAFFNESDQELEGEYLFPVPSGAAVSALAIVRDDVRYEGQVLDSEQAAERYQEIVSSLGDPALLEYVGRGAFRARVYPIPARGSVDVDLVYGEVLPSEGSWLRYHYPLTPERFSREPIGELSLTVHITRHQGLGAIYCPSHDITVERLDARQAVVSFSERDTWPDRDFVLYVGQAETDMHVNLLSYREPGEDGFFMLSLDLGSLGLGDTAPRDYIVLLDTSGSMRGEKMLQAQEGVCELVDLLRDQDRLRVLAFAGEVTPLGDHWFDRDDRETVTQRILVLQAGGGTDVGRALDTALSLEVDARQQVVLLVTDGLPTVGETRTSRILSAAREDSDEQRRLFCLGVGYDVDTVLLDTLSHENHGTSTYVRPDERLDLAMEAFFDKVTRPALCDVRVDWHEAAVSRLAPWDISDVYAGEELLLLGRYSESGSIDVSVRGFVSGEPVERTFSELRLRSEGGADFIPRLWATRQIGERLTKLRLYGPDRETIAEIVELAVRHGVVTPYTSYLVEDELDVLDRDERDKVVTQELAAAQASFAGDEQVRGVGKSAVAASQAQNAMATAGRADTERNESLRWVGAKTFLREGQAWVDTAYDPRDMSLEKVAWGSEAFFSLLARCTEMPRWLALGREVIVVWDGVAYRVTEPGLGDGVSEPTAGVAAGQDGRFVSDWFIAWVDVESG